MDGVLGRMTRLKDMSNNWIVPEYRVLAVLRGSLSVPACFALQLCIAPLLVIAYRNIRMTASSQTDSS